jgi:hypothetical protein
MQERVAAAEQHERAVREEREASRRLNAAVEVEARTKAAEAAYRDRMARM